MAIKNIDGKWLVDIQPAGRGGKRFRKTFPYKSEAVAFEAWIKTKTIQKPEWAPQKKDSRKLLDLIESWQLHHGQQLKAKNTYPKLLNLCKALGNPFVDQFSAEDFSVYRSNRLAAGISPNFINRDHAYLRAVFNELSRLGQWAGENPLKKIRQFKIEEKELSYLTMDQIRTLLKALTGEVLLIVKICLSTGARWSEAEGLRKSQIKNGQIQFSNTKSGKNRHIAIDANLESELLKLEVHSTLGRLFRPAYESFRVQFAASKIILPKGQLTHVLRHTFASHFMINGGNILVLQRLLGHSTLAMTMKYAHLAPNQLEEAKRFNPLVML